MRRCSRDGPRNRNHGTLAARKKRACGHQRAEVQQLEGRTLLSVILNNEPFGLAYDGSVPPDTCGAAGPTSYVETVNQSLAIFSPKATGTNAVTDSFADFWVKQGGLAQPTGLGLSSPTVVWDEQVQRFIIGDQVVDNINVPPTNLASRFNLAVSKSASPATLTSADWHFYQVDTTEAGLQADYPGNIGYNHDAFVCTLNQHLPGAGSGHAEVFSISINDLIDGNPITPFHNDIAGADFRPTVMHDSAAGDPMWLVAQDTNSSVNVVKMTNVLSNGADFTMTPVPVNSLSGPVAPLQPDGTSIATNIKSVILKAAEANNTIVACQNVSASATEDDARWYAFDVGGPTPSLAQHGNISAGNNTYVTFPGIDINARGDIGMSYIQSGAGAGQFMSTYVTGRLASDPADTMETPVLVQAGMTNNRDNRQGDLSGINVDSDGTFWAANEWAAPGGVWGTAVAHFTVTAVTVTNFATTDSANSGPDGLAFDGAGNLYVANFFSNTIDKVTPRGAVSTFITGGALNGPKGLAFDSSGNLYVASFLGGGSIAEYSSAGTFIKNVATALGGIDQMVIDPSNNLYVYSTNGLVKKITPAGVVSTYVTGLSTNAGGLAFDASGNLYVTDFNAGKVDKVPPGGGSFSVFASGFNQPRDIVVDGSGNLFVSNGGNDTISQVNSAGVVSPYVSGAPLNVPYALALDAIGNLYVANGNSNSNTVTKVTPAAPNFTINEGGTLGPVTGLATFAFPPVADPNAANYTATINWEDGSPSSPGNVVNIDSATFGGAYFRVDAPAHLYAEEGAYNPTVTLLHGTDTPLIETVIVNVAEPPLTSLVVNSPSTGTEGMPADFPKIAFFTDPGGAEPSAGDLAPTAAAGISHWYQGENNANDIADTDNGAIVGTVGFAAGKIGQAFSFNGSPGSFVDLGTGASVSGSGDFTISAIIKTTTNGIIIDQRDSANFNGEYLFSVGGTFASVPGRLSLDEFTFGTGIQSFASTASVNDGKFHYVDVVRHASGTVDFYIDGVLDSSTPGSPVPLDPTIKTFIGEDARDNVRQFNGVIDELQIYGNTALSAGKIASINSNIVAGITADYMATINWGDGTTSAASVGNQSGNVMRVFAPAHMYNEEGQFTFTVSITHEGLPALTGSGSVNIIDPPVIGTGGFTFTAVEGVQSATQTVATFKDPGGAEPNASDPSGTIGNHYSAGINWGDGTATTPGTITFNSANGLFTVQGGHTYAEEGAAPIDVLLKHEGSQPQSVESFASVSDQQITTPVIANVPATGVEGSQIGAITGIATFADPAGVSGTIAPSPNGATEAGNTVTINTTSAIGLEVGDMVTVAGVGIAGYNGTFTVTGVPSPTSFTYINSAGLAASGGGTVSFPVSEAFTATINWGDATTSSGAIVSLGGGKYRVDAPAHTYGEEGSFTVNVTVQHDFLPTITTPSQTIVVSDPALIATGGFSFTAVADAPSAMQTVATFTDPGGVEPNASDPTGTLANHYGASINWGDGSPSTPGTITLNNGAFIVQGSHTYADQGNDVITVTLSHEASAPKTITSNAVVAIGSATHFGITAPGSVGAGSPFSVTVTALAADGATASGYRGTIHFTKTDNGAGSAVPADYTFVAADGGIHTFSNGATLVTAGSQTLTATDTGNNSITGKGTITVNPTVQFTVGSATVNQNARTFSVPVTLSGASGSILSVPFTLGGTAISGTDFSGVSASPLVFPAGATTESITGSLIDRGFGLADRTLTFTLGTTTGATLGTTTAETLTIHDSDVEPTVQFSAASETVNESAGTFRITLTQSAPSALATSIPFTLGGTAVAGKDFSGVSASPLGIPAGQTSATITGTLLPDFGNSTTLTFTLGTPTNAILGPTTANVLTITQATSNPAPVLLKTNPGASNEVIVNWMNVDTTSPASVLIDFSTDPTFATGVQTTTVAATAAGTTQASAIEGLIGGSTYYIRLRSMDANGASGGGNVQVVVPVTMGPLMLDNSLGFTAAEIGKAGIVGSGTELVVGGAAPIGAATADNRLRLTDGGGGESTVVLSLKPVDIGAPGSSAGGFTSVFDFQLNNGASADGLSFVVENDPRGNQAHGGTTGGTLGWAGTDTGGAGGIANGADINFNFFSGQGNNPTPGNPNTSNTGFSTSTSNGAVPGWPVENTPSPLTQSGVNFHTGDRLEVIIQYLANAHTLFEQITDVDNLSAPTYKTTYANVDIAASAGGNTAFVGFTGATGGLVAVEDVLNWSYAPTPAGVAPNLLGTNFGDGTTLVQTQRSEVRDIQVKFDEPVTLGAGALTLAAFSGTTATGSTTDASAALGTPTSSDGGITWTVPVLKSTAFSDATGSLLDGIYQLAVHASAVTANVGGLMLNGGDHSTTFHRLFGDIDGNKTVNNADFFQFNKAFGHNKPDPLYNADFDFNGDGKINNSDFFQFNRNFGKKFNY